MLVEHVLSVRHAWWCEQESGGSHDCTYGSHDHSHDSIHGSHDHLHDCTCGSHDSSHDCIRDLPEQVLSLESSRYPLKQLQTKPPGVLLHDCSHPEVPAVHSLISVGRQEEGREKVTG